MGDVVATIVGITLFVLIIAASIGLHEWGHFATARRFGAKVTEFMIGFGPTVWSRRKGETDYGLKAFPLGGYVRIIGMYPPSAPAGAPIAGTAGTGPFSGLIEQAREQAMAEIQPGDEDRVFYKLPVPQRMAVMLAGPFMNLLIAGVLFTIVLAGIGLPTVSTRVQELVACTPSSSNPAGQATQEGGCPAGSVASPSATSDVRPGDEFTAVDGVATPSWQDFTDALQEAGPDSTVALSVVRDGAELGIRTTLVGADYPVVDDQGRPTGETETRAFFGVRPEVSYEPLAVTAVPGYMWDISVMSAQALVSLPARLVELVGVLATGGERDPNGPVSVVGVSRLGGEIAAAEEPFEAKVGTFLALAASLNLFLFLFNLLPLLPLDGGHVAAAAWEGTRRRIARWRGRSDPGPVDTVRLLPLTYAVAMVLIGAGVIVIWADLVKPITFGG